MSSRRCSKSKGEGLNSEVDEGDERVVILTIRESEQAGVVPLLTCMVLDCKTAADPSFISLQLLIMEWFLYIVISIDHATGSI